MTAQTAQLFRMAAMDVRATVTHSINGWLLTAVRDYLAAHPGQMLADPMYLDGKAYLYRRGEYVDLCIVGRPDDLPVFILDPLKGWREIANLDAKYNEWSKRNAK